MEHKSVISDDLMQKLKRLSQLAWDGECPWPVVQRWVEQFDGSSGCPEAYEREEMLFLLSNFIYFGVGGTRGLLRSLYRDIFLYRLIEKVRKKNAHTTDRVVVNSAVQAEVTRTRFLPLGNPSESSSHLLYYFRQENGLRKRLFCSAVDVLDYTANPPRLRYPKVVRYVLIDDFSGSGTQATRFGKRVVTPIKVIAQRLEANVEVDYYVLVATKCALEHVRSARMGSGSGARIFDHVGCVFELTEEYRAFSSGSLFYQDQHRDSHAVKRIAKTYGKRLNPRHPLGYKDGQLVLGFRHNVPNNTIPIFSSTGRRNTPWISPFPRYPKL